MSIDLSSEKVTCRLRRVTELVRICRALAGGHGAFDRSATLQSGEATVQAGAWGEPPDSAGPVARNRDASKGREPEAH